MLIRRSLLAVTVVLALVAVSSAAGEEFDGYTATGTPTHVKPSTSTTFTIALTNKTGSPKVADRAKIGIPTGFAVAPETVQASATAADTCAASTWVADGTLIAEEKINLKSSGGFANRLCPGATLSVVFSATSSGVDGADVWATALLREEDTFLLTSPQPSVNVDGTPPTVTLGSRPANPSNDPTPTFAFSAIGAAGLECKLDGAAFAPCTSPKEYSALGDGSHTFTVQATDAAGNTGTASYAWLLETTLPIVTLTDKPSLASKSSSASFSFTASELGTSECKLDTGAFAACTSPVSYEGLADGPHTFSARATDTAANTGPETSYAWTVDTTAPATAITAKPAEPTNSRSATFAFSSDEPATFRCKLDDGAFALCASPQTYTGLGEGRHTFVVRASDAADNLGPEATYAWTIDTRAPAVAITSAPAGLTNATAASFSFAADEPAIFHCSFDAVGFEPCSSPASRAGLAEGGRAFAVRATDAAGNVAAASRTWAIDATPPQTTLESRPKARTAARSARFAFATNESGAFECRLDAGSYAPCTSPKAYARLSLGVHRFMVRATDAAGNADATPATARWTIGPATTRSAAAALFAPAAGARLTRPPLLRWRAASRATYYNVQLYRAGRKVLTAWPSRTRFQLRMRWRFNGRAEHLKPGVYRWFVWPGYGRVTDLRYGRLLGTSTFVVGRAT